MEECYESNLNLMNVDYGDESIEEVRRKVALNLFLS